MEQTPAASPFSGLWFPKRSDERFFLESYVDTRFRAVDRRRLGLVFVIATTFAVGRLVEDYRDGALTMRGVSATFFAGLYLCLSRLWTVWDVDSKPGLRTRMVMITRLLAGNVPVALLSQVWFSEVVTTPRAVFRFMLMNTGALGLVFHSFAQPLLTWQHLILQVPTVVFMALYTPQVACVGSTVTAESAPYLVAVWEWFNLAWTGARKSLPTPPAQQCCEAVVAMTQIAGGLCVPSYVLWAAEYWARFQFNPRALQQRELTKGAVGVHVALFFPAMSCVWILLQLRAWL